MSAFPGGLPLAGRLSGTSGALAGSCYPIPGVGGFVLLGSVGLIIAALRTLVIFVSGRDDDVWHVEEKRGEWILLVLGVLALFAVGLFPQVFLQALTNMANMFVNFGG